MNVIVRTETKQDYQAVFSLIQLAFASEAYSDHTEHLLVERLRNSDAFIPELSLVAVADNQIVGFILLTKIDIVNAHGISHPSLALAPVAVLPSFQHKGIGSKLIKAAHQKAAELGFKSVVLLGHATYYPKFGYKLTKEFGIKLPFEVPEANCMAIELFKDAFRHVNGVVKYPDAFQG